MGGAERTAPPFAVLTEVLRFSARRFADAPALVMRMGLRTVRLRYRDVLTLAEGIAGVLAGAGIARGDRVLLLAPSSPYWVCAFWGVQLRGAVAVPLNTQSTARMIEDIARQTAARVAFVAHAQRDLLPGALTIFEIDDLPGLLVAGPSSEPAVCAPDDLAEILYTSGTTGNPKGVMLSQRNLCASLAALDGLVPVTPRDRLLSVLPLSHIFEQQVGFLLPFSRGACVIYAHTPAAIGPLLYEYRVTKLVAVPEFLRLLMARIDQAMTAAPPVFAWLRERARHRRSPTLRRLLCWPLRRRLGGCLKVIASGGAALDPRLVEAWETLGIAVLEGYGLTETAATVTSNDLARRRPCTVGRVLPGVELRIAEDSEILVRGAPVFRGYFADPARTEAAFDADGWFHTGDLGEIGGDGFLAIRGRKKYLIKGAGAQNVHPEDIEQVLNRLPGVRDSCVLGVARAAGAVDIHAVVLRSPAGDGGEAALETLVTAANRDLASYQRINHASWWPDADFPRSATRKVKRDLVRERLATGVMPAAEAAADSPLVRLLADLSGRPRHEIAPDTLIVPELNLDSLLRIELVTRIDETFGIDLDEAVIDAELTVAGLEAVLYAPRPARKRRPFKRWLRRDWACALRALLQWLLVFPFARTFVRLDVQGTQHLRDLPLPCILMANHLSIIDSLVLLRAIPARIRWRLAYAAARDVLYDIYRRQAPLVEFLFNAFPFPRLAHENIQDGLDTLGRLLDLGFSVVFFPEGRLSETGALLPLRRGAGLVATGAEVPVVPVRIRGTAAIVPPDGFWPRQRGRVSVHFGAPLHFRRAE
ncbi:MAG: AMP-binding protein, partial [Gammaproteobacteria bacterium]